MSIALGMLVAVVLPTATFADTVITGSLEVPTVTGISPSSGIAGNTITGVTISGTYLGGATAVTFSGSGVTADSIVVASDNNSLTVTVSITASAAQTARDVLVTTPGGTASKTSAFTVTAPTFSLSAPSSFSLGIMQRNQNNTAKSGTNGTVSTTAQNWQVTASGAASNGGYMWNGTASPTAKFQIGKDGSTWTDASGTLTYNQSDTTSFPFWGQQLINGTDPAGTYSITITFTGSAQ